MPKDKQDELFYLVDENDLIIDSITRKRAHGSKNNIHRAIGIFVINELGQILMQKRSLKKDIDPGKWSYSVGGHVIFGQTYKQAAIRELKEELGIKSEPKFITKALIKVRQETEYTVLYEAEIFSKATFNIDKYEVEQIKWIKLDKLKSFVKNHQVTDWTLVALKAAQYF